MRNHWPKREPFPNSLTAEISRFIISPTCSNLQECLWSVVTQVELTTTRKTKHWLGEVPKHNSWPAKLRSWLLVPAAAWLGGKRCYMIMLLTNCVSNSVVPEFSDSNSLQRMLSLGETDYADHSTTFLQMAQIGIPTITDPDCYWLRWPVIIACSAGPSIRKAFPTRGTWLGVTDYTHPLQNE